MRKIIIGLIIAVVLAGMLPVIGGTASGATTDRATVVHVDDLNYETVYAKDLITGYIYPMANDNDSIGFIRIAVQVSDQWANDAWAASAETYVSIEVGNDSAGTAYTYGGFMSSLGSMYHSGVYYKGDAEFDLSSLGLYFNWGTTYFNITVQYWDNMVLASTQGVNDTVFLDDSPDRISHGFFAVNLNGPSGWLMKGQDYPSEYEEVRIKEGDRATSISLAYWVDGSVNATKEGVAANVRTVFLIQKDNETVFAENWTASPFDFGFLPNIDDPSLPWVTAWSASTGQTFNYQFTDGYYELSAQVLVRNQTTGNFTQVAWSNHTVNLVIPVTPGISDIEPLMMYAFGFIGLVGMVMTPAAGAWLYRKGTDPIKVAVMVLMGMAGFGVMIWMGILGAGTL